ncbi:Hsp70 family protein, partial [Anabaena sp. UHCC 0451]|uniref:Hsp70 family protein n=1 Tax=Anabaena sp. UHCC 0451 TaxID=2055235 RepID=UPI002B1E9D28
AYQAEKQIRDLGDKVSAADKNRVEELVKNLREAINQDNFDRVKSLSSELQQALMQIGTAVYAQAGSRDGSSGESQSSRGEDVIDADFVESQS